MDDNDDDLINTRRRFVKVHCTGTRSISVL